MSCRFLPSLFTLTGRMLELISFLCGNVPRVSCEGVVISADAERLIVWAPPPLYTLVWARMCNRGTCHLTLHYESWVILQKWLYHTARTEGLDIPLLWGSVPDGDMIWDGHVVWTVICVTAWVWVCGGTMFSLLFSWGPSTPAWDPVPAPGDIMPSTGPPILLLRWSNTEMNFNFLEISGLKGL